MINPLASAIIFASLIPFGYLLLWLSPDRPGGWRAAGRLRKAVLHCSLWFTSLFQIIVISLGYGGYLLFASFYIYVPITLSASIASAIVFVEVIGIANKKVDDWSGTKRIITISLIAFMIFTFSTIIRMIVRSKTGGS